MAAGFRSPLFILGISAGGTQAGFVGPIPIVNLGAPSGVAQAGFIGPIPIVNLGAGGIIAIPPEVGSPQSGSSYGGLLKLGPRAYLDTSNLRQEENEIIEIVQILLQSGILNQE